MNMDPNLLKANYEFDNGNPAIDPRLKIEETLTKKQMMIIGMKVPEVVKK